jgi:energy-coupling factor transporter ATP-binding protein EcfA2
MTEKWTYDLFISYAEADKAWVEGYLLDALENAEVSCTCESAFTLGVPRILEFERAIRQSQYTLLIVSDAYLADDLTRFIDILAQSYGEEIGTWPVIPLMRQENLQLSSRLKMLEGLTASSSEQWEAAIERLCNQLKRPLPAPPQKPICPYPGMIPFNEKDERHFFGRDEEIEELRGRLHAQHFLTVIGPSGSGKSSLVFAGLIPNLKKSGLFGTGQWCIRSLRPGSNPLANIQTALEGDFANLEVSIQQLLSTQPDAQRLLLVIDQFEELFTQAGTETRQFQEALLQLIEISNVYLILTVRADFYPDLMGSLLWNKIRSHRYEVLPLDDKGLRQAIVRPAESEEVYIDSALVERLLVDSRGEPGVLPLLQQTLKLLWEKLERRFLPLKAYELLVLPRSAYGAIANQPRTGLQVAISLQADAAFGNLEAQTKQAIAQRIFLRLIQFGKGRPDTRRQQLQKDLTSADDDAELFKQTLEHLADCRLLTFSGEENIEQKENRKVDLAHEALISAWPTLQQWIRERRDAEQVRRRLETQAKEWVRLGQSKGGLLDSIELGEAERWLSSSDAKELGYKPSLIDLVTASQQAIQEEARLDRERQQKELILIQEKLEQEKKFRKAEQMRNRVIIGSLGAILIAGIFTWKQQQQTQEAKQVFLDQALNIPVQTPELIKMLPEFLQAAKNLSQKGEEGERAIAYYAKILTEIRKLQEEIHPSQKRETIKETNEEAKRSLIDIIKKVRITTLLKSQLEQGNIGKRTSNTYADLDKQFTGALQTTYKIIMLDTGADINRNGQLDSLDEVKLIPCEILTELEITWQKSTQGSCSFYGENCQKELGKQNLAMTLFPIESQGKFEEYLQVCEIQPIK